VAEALDTHGTIDVLRHGVTDLGVKFDLCQFRPANVLNPTTLVRYRQNRLTVTR